MNKKTMLIVGGIAGVLMLCACVVVAGLVIMNAQKTEETARLAASQTAATEVAVANLAAANLSATQAALVMVENTPQPEPTAAPTEMIAPVPNTETAAIDSSSAKQVANQLLIHLSSREYDDAVSLTDTTLRSDAGTADQLRAIVEEKKLDPIIWEWLNVEENAEKQEIYLDGVANYVEQRRGTVTAHLRVEAGELRVFFLDMQTDGISTDPGAYSQWSEARKTEEIAFAQGSADMFLIDWAADDYTNAYEYSASAMKFEVGSVDKLADILRGLGVHPDAWTWDDYSVIELETLDRPVLELTGTVDYKEGKSGPLTIQLIWEDGYWAVMYFNVQAE